MGTLILFGGYILVYAAVARGGRFATEPWMGLFADAYDTAPASGAAASSPSAPPAGTTPTRPRTSPKTSPTFSGHPF